MRMARPSYRITRKNPGTELAAETAAAMAACSVIFRESNSSYADILVRHAKELYEFADKYRLVNLVSVLLTLNYRKVQHCRERIP